MNNTMVHISQDNQAIPKETKKMKIYSFTALYPVSINKKTVPLKIRTSGPKKDIIQNIYAKLKTALMKHPVVSHSY